MSYASVASHNAPPPSEHPEPDPILLNTSPSTHATATVNVVPPDFKDACDTRASEPDPNLDLDPEGIIPSPKPHPSKSSKGRKKRLQEVEAEGHYIWETAKYYLIRPGMGCGLLGLMNIGLLASVGRIFYLRPHLRCDATAISSAFVATVALISIENIAAEKYRQRPRDEEHRTATKEGTLVFRRIHEQIMRPNVLGGLVGIATLLTLLGREGLLARRK